jgi:uncharacterized protein YndB with AHSA1/START domain
MNMITVNATIQAPITKVWDYWTNPEHVKNWNFAASDWHCPEATNNLEVGGEFHYTMSAKDNSFSFDFWGTYQKIELEANLEIILGDGRHMKVLFETKDNTTVVTESFEPEKVNPEEMQRAGWQMILDNFKKHVEGT